MPRAYLIMKKGEIATGVVMWAGGITFSIVSLLIGAVYNSQQTDTKEVKSEITELRAVDASTIQRVSKNEAQFEEMLRRLDKIDKKLDP